MSPSIERVKTENNRTKIADIADAFNLTREFCYRKLVDFGDKYNFKVIAEVSYGTLVHDELAEHLYAEHDRAQSLIINQNDIKPSGFVPIEKGHYIYFLLSLGEIVYIGQSCNLLHRIGTHTKDKCFDEVFCSPVSPKDMDMTEEVNIMFYKPPLNVTVWEDKTYFTKLLYKCGSHF